MKFTFGKFSVHVSSYFEEVRKDQLVSVRHTSTNEEICSWVTRAKMDEELAKAFLIDALRDVIQNNVLVTATSVRRDVNDAYAAHLLR